MISSLVAIKSTPKVIEQFLIYGISKKFLQGDIILREDAYIKAIPIVISGSLRVMRTDDYGREILLYYINAGESCILAFLGSLLNDISRVNVIAEEETEILLLPIEKVNLLIKESPEWLDYIFRLCHQRFEELLEAVNAIAFKKVDERLLDFIKKKCELTHNKTIIITHEKLANELGTARVVVSRLLKHMEVEGLVKLGRNKITLM